MHLPAAKLNRCPARLPPCRWIATLWIATWAFACAPPDGPAGARTRPTNVVLISLDTLRADRLNAYGYGERLVSPNLDSLAGDSVLFERCAAAAAWTTPAHASLFTAQYPSTHGLTQSFLGLRSALEQGGEFNRLAQAQTTLAEVLRSEGRATAAFTGGVTLDPVLGFGQGFERYESSMFKLDRRNMGALEEWLDERNGKPFFLFWHTFEVHTPFLDTRFLDGVLDPAACAALRSEIAELGQQFAKRPEDLSFGADLRVAELRAILTRHGAYTRDVADALYCGGVASADHWVGELVAMLRARDLYEDTLIIVTSDHGEELGDHDPESFYHSHGHSMYDELVRVPLLIKLPGDEFGGKRVETQVSVVDIMPTILDLIGAQEPPAAMQGVSLRGEWEGRIGEEARSIPIEALLVENEKKAIHGGGYKYILSVRARDVRRFGRQHIPQDGVRELYDLRTDPGERENLLGDNVQPEHRAIADALDAKLRESLGVLGSAVESVPIDAEMLEGLRALGYGGDGPGDED